jgi:EpsI family protein
MTYATVINKNTRQLAVGVVMIVAAGLAFVLIPRSRIADQRPKVNLEIMIPEYFGNWSLDKTITPVQVSPDVKSKLNEIYNQTLSRTYIDVAGRRVMLSIAYGGNQTDNMAIHLPEGCYPAQGFHTLSKQTIRYNTGFGSILVNRLVEAKEGRVEPITYWVVIGDSVALGTGWKLQQLKYTLTGVIPDGLIFRVSSLGTDVAAEYKLQDEFIRSLLTASSTETKHRLIGMQ